MLALLLGLSLALSLAWLLRRVGSRAPPALAPPPARPALPAAERGLLALRVGDAVLHLGADFLVAAVLRLEEEGAASRPARLARLDEGTRTRWLYVRAGEPDPLLLDETPGPDLPLVAGAPDALELAGLPFRLVGRHAVGVHREGGTIALPGPAALACLYAGPGGRTLLVLAFRERALCYLGERVPVGVLELLAAD